MPSGGAARRSLREASSARTATRGSGRALLTSGQAVQESSSTVRLVSLMSPATTPRVFTHKAAHVSHESVGSLLTV